MSLEGPCSVLRGGMRGFPFDPSSDSRASSRDQAQRQQHHYPLPLPMGSRFGGLASTAWDAGDEGLPDVLASPRLRSVSSLVLSSDVDESLSHHLAGVPRVRRFREPEVAATAVSSGLSPRFVDMLDIDTLTQQLPPPPASGGSNRLIREQSFPPPHNSPPGAGPRLVRDQSFPPPVQPGLPMDLISTQSPTPVGDWSMRHMTRNPNAGADVEVRDSGARGGRLDGGGRRGVGGGREGPSSSGFHRFSGESLDIKHERGSGSGSGQWDLEGSGNLGSGRGAGVGPDDEDVLFHPLSSPRGQHDRRPSFDKLAAMIPGIPHWPSPSSSPLSAGEQGSSRTTSVKQKPAVAPQASDMALPSRGRQPTRTMKPKKTGEDAGAARGGGGSRLNKKPGSGKRGEAPLSCGPASADGGPVDLEKQARRREKIQRYLYKRSRRRFANSTRDASPSRSRPKAAKVRPRDKGKFVKTVPDFIPVTAVAADGCAEANVKPTRMPPAPRAAAETIGVRGGRGGSARHHRARSAPIVSAWRPTPFECPVGGSGVPPRLSGAALHVSDDFCYPPSSM